VAIPFVFWGMGDLFRGGNQNTIFTIGKEKISSDEFIEYIKIYAPRNQELNPTLINNLLSGFIGEKLVAEEINDFKIKLSDDSLSLVIKNQEIFKKENKFSRTEYEKFLVTNSLNAVAFEAHVSMQEKRKQMLDIIGSGVIPSNFLISMAFDKTNQKRNIQIINLNNLFKKKINVSSNEILTYFDKNKDLYKKIYKSIKFIELNPKNLAATDEFNDLFFEKLDEIDDLIAAGENVDFIFKKYNLESFKTLILDEFGKDKNSNVNHDIPLELIKNIFNSNESEPTTLISHNEKYFIFEVFKTESIQKDITDESIKKEIISNLEKISKRRIISEMIGEINNKNFNKSDFDKLSKDENLVIEKIKLENINDNKILKTELVNQIYAFSEKKVIIVASIGLSQSFLVYIDSIENASINKESKDYRKYMNLSKDQITNSLYNTYDAYLKKKYKVDINYKALDAINNYFR